MNLQEFSARKFGPEKYQTHFRNILGKVAQGGRKCAKSTPKKVKYGLFWVAVGPFGLEMVPYESELV